MGPVLSRAVEGRKRKQLVRILERIESMRQVSAARLFALVALILWCTALFAPISAVPLAGSSSRFNDPYFHNPYSGWVLAVFGWLGPLGLAPGWYANIPLAMGLNRCL